MLEIFSRDRDFDFEFFEISDSDIKYKLKKYGTIDNNTKELYKTLEYGTVVIDGVPVTVDNVSKEQLECINTASELFKDKYKEYKSSYTPYYFRYTSGSSMAEVIANKNIIEVPDPKHFKEWAFIKGYEGIQNFIDEYQKQNNKYYNVKSKIKSLFLK